LKSQIKKDPVAVKALKNFAAICRQEIVVKEEPFERKILFFQDEIQDEIHFNCLPGKGKH